MSPTTPRRPPMLAGACAYLGILAAVQSVRAIVLVSTWNAENGAEKVGPQLDALRDSGLSQASAESGYKVFLTVLAVLAATGVVFAVFTARGDRPSRVGLTVVMVSVGVFFFLGATGGSFFDAIIGALAIVFTIRLWTGESRAFFRSLRTGEPLVAAGASTRPDPFAQKGAPGVDQPVQHPAEQPAYQQPPQQQSAAPYPQPHYPQPYPPARQPLPGSVGIAAWTALIGSIVAGLGSALVLLAFLLIGTDYDSWVAQGGPGADMLQGQEEQFESSVRYLLALSSISLAVAAGGLFASIRMLVTRHSGEVVLFVMTVVGLVVSVIGFPLGLPWTAATIVVLVQLRKPDSRRWFVKT